MNEYNGPHAERLKFANKHLGKAVNEYDNLKFKNNGIKKQINFYMNS